ELSRDLDGCVLAAVVHEYDFEGRAELPERLHYGGVQRAHALLLVVQRHDDRDPRALRIRRSTARRGGCVTPGLRFGCNFCLRHPEFSRRSYNRPYPPPRRALAV